MARPATLVSGPRLAVLVTPDADLARPQTAAARAMSNCGSDVAAYALGALDDAERRTLRAPSGHLRGMPR